MLLILFGSSRPESGITSNGRSFPDQLLISLVTNYEHTRKRLRKLWVILEVCIGAPIISASRFVTISEQSVNLLHKSFRQCRACMRRTRRSRVASVVGLGLFQQVGRSRDHAAGFRPQNLAESHTSRSVSAANALPAHESAAPRIVACSSVVQ